jgi:hypothetical protein
VGQVVFRRFGVARPRIMDQAIASVVMRDSETHLIFDPAESTNVPSKKLEQSNKAQQPLYHHLLRTISSKKARKVATRISARVRIMFELITDQHCHTEP